MIWEYLFFRKCEIDFIFSVKKFQKIKKLFTKKFFELLNKKSISKISFIFKFLYYMKKVLFLLALVFILTSCWKIEINNNVISNTKVSEELETMTWNLKTNIVKSNQINETFSKNFLWITSNKIQEYVSSWSINTWIILESKNEEIMENKNIEYKRWKIFLKLS